MYTTLNDGLLQEWCVGNYDHEELMIDTRAKIFEKGLAPEEIAAYTKHLLKNPIRGENPQKILEDDGVDRFGFRDAPFLRQYGKG